MSPVTQSRGARLFEVRPALRDDQVIEGRLFAPVVHYYLAPFDQHSLQHRAEDVCLICGLCQ